MAKVQVKLEDERGDIVFLTLDPEVDVQIDENNTEAEACRQVQLMVEYGRAYALSKSMALRADSNIKITEAVIGATYREDCAKAGKKVTEGGIEEHVHSHPDYIEAIEERTRTSAISALTYTWWATVQQRADMLKLIGYRQNTEIKYAE